MDEELELVNTSAGNASKTLVLNEPPVDGSGSGSESLPPYQYDSLPEGPFIRLFKIENSGPTSDDDPIKITMTTCHLVSVKDKFDALSYMWGEANETGIIEVDGKSLRIRRNLFDFLAQLRASHVGDFIWADAISINQDDTSEKNHQVQQMSAIYRSCRQSRVWLGLSADRLEILDRYDRKTGEPIKKYAMSFKNSMSPYWKRLWIVQELILPPRVLIHLHEEEAFLGTFLWRNMTGKSKAFEAARTIKGPRSLNALLRTYGHYKCQDHRDRVYGLLGLIEGDAIKVDYNLSKSALFIRTLQDFPNDAAELARPLARALDINTSPLTSPLSSIYSTSVRVPLRPVGDIEHNKYFPVWRGRRRAYPLPHFPPPSSERDWLAFTIARQMMQLQSAPTLIMIFDSTSEVSASDISGESLRQDKTAREKPIPGEAVTSAMIEHPLDLSTKVADRAFLRYNRPFVELLSTRTADMASIYEVVQCERDRCMPSALAALLPDPTMIQLSELAIDFNPEYLPVKLDASMKEFKSTSEQMSEYPADEFISSILEKFSPGCLSEAKIVQPSHDKEDEIWLQIPLSDLLNLIHVGVLW